MRALLIFAVLAGCTSNDPCDGLGTCLGLTVKGDLAIDQLLIEVSGQVNGTRRVPPSPHAATLPQSVALEFNPPGGFQGQFGFTITVSALREAIRVGEGEIKASISVGDHGTAEILVRDSFTPEPAVDLARPGAVIDLSTRT